LSFREKDPKTGSREIAITRKAWRGGNIAERRKHDPKRRNASKKGIKILKRMHSTKLGDPKERGVNSEWGNG